MSRLVVVSLSGNLGNQLFQFAAAKGVQGEDDRPAAVDSRLSKEWPNRLRGVLRPGRYREARQSELLRLRQVPRLNLAQRTLIQRREKVAGALPLLHLDRYEVRDQNATKFDPSVLERKGPVLLRGYFQSERYFVAVADTVREAVTDISSEATDRFRSILAAFSDNPNLVGVSLRTGRDYQAFGVMLPRHYYESAVALVVSRLRTAAFVLFGDVAPDCANLAAELSVFGPTISVADLAPITQFHLMRMLPHLVLSNSSFAWWGAWLGDGLAPGNHERLVIAPDPWVTDSDEIVPDRWIKVHHDGFEIRASKRRPLAP